ncbi:MAG: NAD(P)-dependent oxidoreductase [Herpetosiphonaceae bacterium]|nr:NAD(P)-dependent oxidoreductase [Herpetosiphonaceae bacterium]
MTNIAAPKRKILLTGAAGRIGTAFRTAAADRYDFRLGIISADQLPPDDGQDRIIINISNLDDCQQACQGIDTVVHLAADPSPAADFYHSLLDNNIKGTYNIFRAAKDQGCARVIFASSIHAVDGYPQEQQVQTSMPVQPPDMYGVSKCFGEAVGAYFATREGLSGIAIRIGAFEAPWIDRNPTDLHLSAFISKRDMSHLLVQAIETPGITFAIVHGISNNRFKRLDITTTRALLGYEPQDDGFAIYRGNRS